MIQDRIIRQSDFDQVLFLGENTVLLAEHRMTYPQSTEFSDIIYGEPSFFGMSKKERHLSAIDNKRILKQAMKINGRNTMVVLAEVYAVDKNRSFLDMLTTDMQREINNLQVKNKFISDDNQMLLQFVKEKHLETSWEEWLQNKLELIRVASVKMTGRAPETTPVAIDIGRQEKEK